MRIFVKGYLGKKYGVHLHTFWFEDSNKQPMAMIWSNSVGLMSVAGSGDIYQRWEHRIRCRTSTSLCSPAASAISPISAMYWSFAFDRLHGCLLKGLNEHRTPLCSCNSGLLTNDIWFWIATQYVSIMLFHPDSHCCATFYFRETSSFHSRKVHLWRAYFIDGRPSDGKTGRSSALSRCSQRR